MAELKTLPTSEVIREMKYSELMNLLKDARIKTKFDGEKRGDLAEKIIKELEGPSSKETESENFVSELTVIFNNIQKEDDELESKHYRDHDDIVAIFEETMDNEDSSLNPDELETIFDRTLLNFFKPKPPVKEIKKDGAAAVDGAKKKGKPKTQYDITEEQQAIIDNDDSKSDKIRQLHALGVPVAIIAEKIDVQYSHAYTVVKKITDSIGGLTDKKSEIYSTAKESVEIPEEEDDDNDLEEMPEAEQEEEEELVKENTSKNKEVVSTSALTKSTEKAVDKVTEKSSKDKSNTKDTATKKTEKVVKEKSVKKQVIKKLVKLVIEVARILPD